MLVPCFSTEGGGGLGFGVYVEFAFCADFGWKFQHGTHKQLSHTISRKPNISKESIRIPFSHLLV